MQALVKRPPRKQEKLHFQQYFTPQCNIFYINKISITLYSLICLLGAIKAFLSVVHQTLS